jgi:hypothetical protein
MQIRDLLQLQLPVGPGTQFDRIQLSVQGNAVQSRISAEISFGANTPTFPLKKLSTAVAFESALYRATGSAFDRPYDRAKFSLVPVGTGRIEFGHNNSATVVFTIDGKTVVKTITRQPI